MYPAPRTPSPAESRPSACVGAWPESGPGWASAVGEIHIPCLSFRLAGRPGFLPSQASLYFETVSGGNVARSADGRLVELVHIVSDLARAHLARFRIVWSEPPQPQGRISAFPLFPPHVFKRPFLYHIIRVDFRPPLRRRTASLILSAGLGYDTSMFFKANPSSPKDSGKRS